MAAARHGSHRGRDSVRERELDLERSRRSKEYHHHRRHRSRDRGWDRRSDGGHSRWRELSDRYSRHRSPLRSRLSGRVEDREPGELSNGSGSEESRERSLKTRARRENGVVKVCRYGAALSPSRKRKHSPVQDANVFEAAGNRFYEEQNGDGLTLKRRKRWLCLKRRKVYHLLMQLKKYPWERATSPEPGELLVMSGGNSSISPSSMLVQESENEDLEEDEGNCMDVAVEHDIDSPAGCLLDTDVESNACRSGTPENVQPPRRCVNMLQSCRSIDEFERLNTINEGTYGVVFRVRDKKADEVVALKKIKIDKKRELEEGFPLTSLREINILLSLHHPSIVDVKEVVVGGHDNDTFMVMEYMEHDLKGVMEAMEQPYHQSEVKCLMLQLLEGVKYLHDNWVLHRDLKTSNLLLNNRGKPFSQQNISQMAPELLLGAKEYSTAIDMWSLGCIMAELLTKKPLFSGKTEIAQLNEMFRMLGTPNDEIWPDYSKLPGARAQFVKQPRNRLREKFPAVSFTGGLTLSESGFDLLNRLLAFDPEKRISADAALNHEWFREVPLPKTKDFMPTLPALNEQDRRFNICEEP
ncbi:hypothetical protein PR202_ga01904 [Eleusine coracana subsp. coracana]|uniref:Protein kinase domain-containing protein n=1 Tax=Eleusine coracana subsp. coracana TaxID=191504 RepID=A0AAV5BG94_ELECO|nr:hypothetical protein PR202_ga01217 [Eleusine coracana subsp. coracana]GJM86084.1 hypothetical protein PR202_ga01904 [Eleusine coracana subsp. coracana]